MPLRMALMHVVLLVMILVISHYLNVKVASFIQCRKNYSVLANTSEMMG